MRNKATQDLQSWRAPIISAQRINPNRKHFLPETSKVIVAFKVTAGLWNVLMKWLISAHTKWSISFSVYLLFFWQSPYNPGQNAGSAPLVYSPQTQPMNAQPQSRPVSVPLVIDLQHACLQSVQTVLALLWLLLKAGVLIESEPVMEGPPTKSSRNVDWS